MVFVPKVVDGESREFVVLLPVGVQFDEPALQKRIAGALREAFPDARFSVIGVDPLLRVDGFTIVPIIEEIDGVRTSRSPSAEVVAAIVAFLTVNFATIRAPQLH